MTGGNGHYSRYPMAADGRMARSRCWETPAHAMLPFAAQGAGMAIEDAAVLAKCLGGYLAESHNESGPTIPPCCNATRGCAVRVWRRFSAPRGRRGEIYHLTGPAALARDLTIKALGAKRMLVRQNWIYDWRV